MESLAACKLPGSQLQIRSKAFHVPLSIRASSDCLNLCDFLSWTSNGLSVNSNIIHQQNVKKAQLKCNQCQQSTKPSSPLLCTPERSNRGTLPSKLSTLRKKHLHSFTPKQIQPIKCSTCGGLEAFKQKIQIYRNTSRTYNFPFTVGPVAEVLKVIWLITFSKYLYYIAAFRKKKRHPRSPSPSGSVEHYSREFWHLLLELLRAPDDGWNFEQIFAACQKYSDLYSEYIVVLPNLDHIFGFIYF